MGSASAREQERVSAGECVESVIVSESASQLESHHARVRESVRGSVCAREQEQ